MINIFSLVYSLSYFLIRGMMPIFLPYFFRDWGILAVSLFNLLYSVAQSFNGIFMEKFGLRAVGFSGVFLGIVMIFLKYMENELYRVVLFCLLGVSCSLATLNLSFFTKEKYKSSAAVLGGLRLLLNFFISFFILFLFQERYFSCYWWGIILFNILLGIYLIYNGFEKKVSDLSIENSGRAVDLIYFSLFIHGVLASIPYFFNNSGFMNILLSKKELSSMAGLLTFGFGAGNLFVVLSQYLDSMKIVIGLSLIQIFALWNIKTLYFPIGFTFFMIGLNYACHIIYIGYILKNYRFPIFLSGFFNFLITLFASFIFLQLVKMYLGSSQSLEKVWKIINILSKISIFNFVLSLGNLYINQRIKISKNS